MARTSNSDFAVFSTAAGEASGCTYYRVQVPLRGLFKLGLANSFIDNGRLDPEKVATAMLSSDVYLMFATGGIHANARIEMIRNMNAGHSDDGGQILYPPSVVFDLDDNLDWVHPFNSTFVHLGTRAYDGTILTPGDSLTTTLADGTEVVIWQDGKPGPEGTLFQVEENHKRVAGVHNTARRADGVTVPSPYLAKYYKEVHKCTSVHVFPNSIFPEDYPKVALRPHDGIRILWQGGGSHMIDWFPLREAVKTICLKYPQVKFIVWGTAYKWIHGNIPEDQLELHDWVPYDAYKPMRILMDADINLCPLVDNEFNRSKSAIKWYEGLLGEHPEPVLAGNCGPYAEEIIDGKTGLLYSTPEEFVEKLSVLIENEAKRKELGENAYKWVMENRHYEKTIPGLFEFYGELRARKKLALEA